MAVLKVVSIGGFGHSVCVFDDMLGMQETQLCGLAPAYSGENISGFENHPLCNDPPIFDDYETMLKKVKPDVAIISNRLDAIPDIAIKAAQAGCHLICEKPLALNHKKLDEVYNAVKSANVRLVAMLSMRSRPQFIAARQIYQSGAIGEAVIVNGRKSYKWGNARPEWFGQRDKYGTTIGWVGIHAFDFINYITGLEFSSIGAMYGNFAHPERPACQDNCGLVFSLNNGGHGTVSVDLFRPHSANTHGDDWIRVVGKKGVIEAGISNNNCSVIVEGKEPCEVQLPEKGKIFKDFFLSLIDGRKCDLTQHDSFMLTSTSLCANDSADKQTIEKIKVRDWS